MEDDELLTLVGLFYEGIMSPQGWRQALVKLAETTSSAAASLVLWDRKTDNALVGEQIGLPEELQRDYADYYHTLDHGREFVDRIKLGDWYLDERELGQQRMLRSPFYQDFLRCYELDSSMASPILRTNTTDGFLSLSGRAGRRDHCDIARSLSRLMPHLQHAAQLRLQLVSLSVRNEWNAQLLDRFQFPLLVVSANKTVVLTNSLGNRWLGMPGNPLAAGSPHARQIGAILQQACLPAGPGKASGLCLKKANGAVYYLTTVPLPMQSAPGWWGTERAALLLVNDGELRKLPSDGLLRDLFQFTPAEIRLTRLLLQGATLQETSGLLNTSVDTGRTHLKSVFAKLGIRRQSDLHRMLGWVQVFDHG
jgi:DNA-binding CsgD family transcriptional regulator